MQEMPADNLRGLAPGAGSPVSLIRGKAHFCIDFATNERAVGA